MSRFQTLRLALPLLFAGLATSVFAVDGVVLIDQNRALTGNITPGDAPGFPVTISQPGSYRLSGNLTAPVNFGAIEISSGKVTIDLNGFAVNCSLQLPALITCIRTTALLDSIALRNGTVAGSLVAGGSPSGSTGYIGISFGDFNSGFSQAIIESVVIITPPPVVGFDTALQVGPYSMVRRVAMLGAGSLEALCPITFVENIKGTITAGLGGSGCVSFLNLGFPALP